LIENEFILLVYGEGEETGITFCVPDSI